ncbi:MAG: hypothetical protein ACF8PN_16545 [Phycisphaerales bacterium]
MGNTQKPKGPTRESVARGHEADHPRIGLIFGVSAALAVVVVVSAVAVSVLVDALATGRGRELAPSTARFGLVEPSEENPVWDLGLEAFQLHAEQRLAGYEWVDAEREFARIPIERAMEIVAEQGVSAATPADSNGEGGTP